MLVGIVGAIRGGKSTATNFLVQNCNSYKAYNFADALKEHCCQFLPKEEIGWNGTDWTGPKTEAGRACLQEHGEGERKKNPNCWLDVVREKVKNDPTFIGVVGDARYINELDWIAANGKILYIHNEKAERAFIEDYKKRGKDALHSSEVEWRLWLLCNQGRYRTVDNNSTLERLKDIMVGYYNIEIKRGTPWEE